MLRALYAQVLWQFSGIIMPMEPECFTSVIQLRLDGNPWQTTACLQSQGAEL